jgi:hypothetical protein
MPIPGELRRAVRIRPAMPVVTVRRYSVLK